MKLLKPHWVHHDDKPIFSVDVHQECHKFATGGQGNDSGRVVIWNLLPVLSEKAEFDPTIPKILCQMDNHLACVNCVRWSQSGQMLASGSDDKLVMIWKISKGSSGVFGTGGITKNPENWKCVSTLRGHAGDVLDLAWSPQDRWLASCSVDNTIIVWDIQALPAMVTVLKGHTGLVKGVTWDPVGKFLASQSDDRSVKIWKTSDWSCSSTITEPFEECGGTTHILRLSWSPDGQYLVSAHAMNGGGPTAQIIEREGWKCDKDFVGHRKAVTCVRFHNSILKRQAPKTNKSQQYCCLAVGSRDCSLSVWMTALQRPLVVIHDLFRDSVLDLSWGPNKYILLACSGDGTVACLRFTDKELGTPLSEDEKNALYQRIYGKNVTADIHGSSGRDFIIENAELLNCVQGNKLKPPTLPTVQPQLQSTMENQKNLSKNNFDTQPPQLQQNSTATTPVKAINKQIETRTADGKRRITPMFIPLNQDLTGDITTPELNSSSRNFNSNNGIREKSLIDSSSHTTVSIINEEKHITAEEEIHLDSRLTKSSNATNIPLAPTRSLVLTKTLSTDGNRILNTTATERNNNSTNNKTQSQVSTGGPPRVNCGPIGKSQSDHIKSTIDYRVQIQNGNLTTNMGALSKITCWSIAFNEKLWETYVGSTIVNFCVCSKYILLCSSDGTIRFLNIKNGTIVLPIISLSMAAAQCSFCPLGILGGVITETGEMRIWDIQNKSVYISATCNDIFKSHSQVIQFNITDKGIPFVLFSNGNAYSFSKQMQCWMILNSKDPIIRYGLQTTIPKDFQKNLRLYPLTSVQAATHNFNSQTSLIDLNSNNWQSTAKLIFIENQIKICEIINSPDELKYWYSMLGYYLATNGTEKRVRLVLDDLLGPPSAAINSDDRKIINVDKKSLLEVILNNLKLHPKWQRIYMEYMEQLQFSNLAIK